MSFNVSETLALRDEYVAAGLIGTWEGNFINSIATSGVAPRGRGIEILDGLIKKGNPQSWPCWSESVEILKIAETCTRPDEASTLRDFAEKIKQGKTLSERQKWFLEKLKNGAKRDLNIVELTSEKIELITGLDAKMRHMSPHYWGNRPGTHRRLASVFEKFKKSDKKFMDVEEYEFACGSFKGFVATFNSSKITHAAGTLCTLSASHIPHIYTHTNYLEKTPHLDALIVSDSTIDSYGRIVVDILVLGKITQIKIDALMLPRKTRKKKSEE